MEKLNTHKWLKLKIEFMTQTVNSTNTKQRTDYRFNFLYN